MYCINLVNTSQICLASYSTKANNFKMILKRLLPNLFNLLYRCCNFIITPITIGLLRIQHVSPLNSVAFISICCNGSILFPFLITLIQKYNRMKKVASNEANKRQSLLCLFICLQYLHIWKKNPL